MSEMNKKKNAFSAFSGGRVQEGVPSRLRVLRRVEITGKCPVPNLGEGKAAESVSGGRFPYTQAEEEAEFDRRSAYEEAWNEGFGAGYREGKEQAWSEVRGIVGALETVRRGLENSRSDLLRELEKEIVTLALEIAEKLALQELTSNPEAVSNLVRRVIDRAAEKKSLRVRLSPSDYRLLREKRRELIANMVDVGHLDLVEDGNLQPGDCVVETAAGLIDARLHRRLERIRDSVLGEEETGNG